MLDSPTPIRCQCGFTLYDGAVLRCRVLRLDTRQAKCSRCKRWVDVALALADTGKKEGAVEAPE